MGKVYIIQDAGILDFSKAKKYGELVPMIEESIFPNSDQQQICNVVDTIKTKLKDFNPANDYILLTGDPLSILITALVLSGMGIFYVICLKWDRELKDYYRVIVNI